MSAPRILLVAFCVVTACKRNGATPDLAQPRALAAALPVERGRVRGVVSLNGPAPTLGEEKRAADAFCARTPEREQEVRVKDGKLASVLVRLLGAPATEPPAGTVDVEQSRCSYRPRVLGGVVGQTLVVRNADPVLHNVRATREHAVLWNEPQIPNAPNLEKRLDTAGQLVELRCDIHQWMRAFVWVHENPWFAVTGEDGAFDIAGIPPGKYELEAWHERFGSKRTTITVDANRTTDVPFAFTPTDGPH